MTLRQKPCEAFATLSEYDMYLTSIGEIENRIVDDSKFPIIRDNKIKRCCQATLELSKIVINYLKYNINNATQERRQTQTKNKGQ